MKEPLSVRVEPDVLARLKKIAEVDERTLGATAAMAVERGLALLEEELAEKLKRPAPTKPKP